MMVNSGAESELVEGAVKKYILPYRFISHLFLLISNKYNISNCKICISV